MMEKPRQMPGTTRRWATSYDFPQPPGRGPNGRGFCRWCHEEVPERRRTWCSEACVDEYWVRANAQEVRRIVLKRDGGVCALCHIEAERLFRIMHHASRHGTGRFESLGRFYRILEPIGNFHAFGGTFWQPDHIVPVAEGGGMCGLSNYRTLCTPCHLNVTKLQARRKAANARGATRAGMLEADQLGLAV